MNPIDKLEQLFEATTQGEQRPIGRSVYTIDRGPVPGEGIYGEKERICDYHRSLFGQEVANAQHAAIMHNVTEPLLPVLDVLIRAIALGPDSAFWSSTGNLYHYTCKLEAALLKELP